MPGRDRGLSGPRMSDAGPGWSGAPATECLWCGAGLDRSALHLAGRVVCGNCGCGTTDPLPDEASLDAAYRTYRPDGPRFAFGGEALLRRSRATLANRIDRAAPSGRVLDVGAGDGNLIDALSALGRPSIGLERKPARDDILDLPVSEVEGEFAAIVFWHSLEHLPDPSGAIEAAHNLLVPGGLIFIAVPDLAGRQARIFGDRWLHLDLPRHLVHLRSDSLVEGLRRRGFVTEVTSGTRAGQNLIGWLDGLVRSLPGDLNLYQALRRKGSRQIPMTETRRLLSIAAGVVLAPVAIALSAIEIATGRTGSIYVEARRA